MSVVAGGGGASRHPKLARVNAWLPVISLVIAAMAFGVTYQQYRSGEATLRHQQADQVVLLGQTPGSGVPRIQNYSRLPIARASLYSEHTLIGREGRTLETRRTQYAVGSIESCQQALVAPIFVDIDKRSADLTPPTGTSDAVFTDSFTIMSFTDTSGREWFRQDSLMPYGRSAHSTSGPDVVFNDSIEITREPIPGCVPA